jgi:hypothetical protein
MRCISPRTLSLIALLTGLTFAACKGPTPQPLETRRTEALTKRTPSAEAPPPASTAYKLPAVPRLVAIGDLHGDFEATKQVFELAGATNAEGTWVGGTLVVVQTGDQLDRGDGEREILDFLDRVREEARAAGGAVHVLNGNHEIMNVAGDYRYVTPSAMHTFDGLFPRATGADRAPEETRGRASAFLPGGAVARRLATRPVIVQVGDTIFAHAGVRLPTVDYGIDRLNRETSAWMRGERPAPPRLVQDEEGPVWTRLYGSPDLDERACAELSRTLDRLGAARLVVGHTVMENVREGCGGKVQRIDVGLSRAYGTGPISALEITAQGTRVLSEARH